ncbi:acyl-CoA dehydrogenase family protein [Nocardiopsis sp. NPDC006198]|uniref:acyl-CoA dehydrogenase family protein n=1 Tax=Nocardiopsis sp. NPDC006198 TaxID=3154472 RepID=UPI0033B9965C
MTATSAAHRAGPQGHGAWWEPARLGEPAEAWAALTGAEPAPPVFGASGFALARAAAGPTLSASTAVVGEITVAGHRWSLLASTGTPENPATPEWRAAVASIRLGLSLWLRRQVVGRLRKRTVEGTALIHRQLVRADLAHAATEQAMAESLLDSVASQPGAAAALSRASRRLTTADRTVLRLYGASGFLSDGPGQVAYLSELMADAYLESATDDRRGEPDDRVG